jgi:methyl-accepting chemotaxis protein
MFKNMKVGTKLIAGFLSIAIIGAIVAAIGIYNMGRINEMADRIYERELLGLSHVKDANINLVYAGRARGNFLLATTAEERAQNKANIGKYLDQVRVYMEKARPLFVLPRAKEIYQRYATINEAYEKEQATVFALASSEKLAEQSAELKKALVETRKHANELDDLLTDLAQLKEGLAKQAAEETTALYEKSLIMMIVLVLCSLGGGMALGILITRNLTKKLGGEPDYAVDIAGKIAAGDLTVAVNVKPGDQTSLLHAMQKMRDSLAGLVSQVRTGTETIASASNQIAAGNLDLSSRTEEQASSLEETASSMEELTSTVKQNADNARQANALAEAASTVAAKGGQVIQQVVGTMNEINSSATKIVDIIGVIDGIAFQTNILALNAAVEAARAGEQGRGFAVVATEVRNLAQRSAAAAKEIKALIGTSVEKVENGSRLVNDAGATMDEILDSVKRVTDIMAEITAASQEQTAGIEQINQAISQMDEVTQQNASLVEEAAAAAAAMQDQSEQLAQVVSVFKVDGMGNATAARPAIARAAPSNSARLKTRTTVPASSAVAIKARRPMPKQVATSTITGEWTEF